MCQQGGGHARQPGGACPLPAWSSWDPYTGLCATVAPITAIGTDQTPGGTKDVKNKVKNTHTRTLAPLSWSPPMSNVSTPPGKGGADLK